MSLSAWRIVKRRLAKTAFSGEGARQAGGRWNSAGVPMVYTAGSQALAVLEMVVHLESADLLQSYVLFEVEFDERLIARLDDRQLPAHWREYPPPAEAQRLGDAWVDAASSVALDVPSVLLPAERNFLLNPRHPDFPKLRIGKPQPFQFDPRLAR